MSAEALSDATEQPAKVRTVPGHYFDESGQVVFPNVHTGYGTTFEIIGHGVISHDKHYPYAVHEDVLAAADALELARELGKEDGYTGYDDTLIYTSPNDGYPADREGAKWNMEYPFHLEEERIVSRVAVRAEDATLVPKSWRDGLVDLAGRHDCVVLGTNTFIEETPTYDGIWPTDNDPDDLSDDPERSEDFQSSLTPDRPRTLGVILALNPGGIRMSSLVACARDMTAYLRALTGVDRDSPKAVQSWMRGKNFNLLTGLHENDWLEVKSAGYRMSAPADKETVYAQKIELAQDVARFINGGRDAIIVVGYSEKILEGRKTIARPRAVPLTDIAAQQYRDVIDEHVFPLVEGLEVDTIESGNNSGFLTIFIPSQPPHLLPFLVSGAVVEGRAERTFVSVVRRRVSQIHAEMTAGRAFLRLGITDVAPEPRPISAQRPARSDSSPQSLKRSP
jgi:hypothetical protein